MACQRPQPFFLRGGAAQKEAAIWRRCGQCPACQQTRLNDIEGRIAAHSLVCTHVDMMTFTYDDERGDEAKLGAKIRYAKHHSDFVKRLRERERYHLLAYNRAELLRAEREGRAPELVDATQSYIDVYSVHEYGTTKTKRSHWHSLVFYRSHFPVPDSELARGDRRATKPHLRRVWSPPSTQGYSAKLPPCANDPKVLSYKTTSFQEWDLWPWGGVQVESATHWRSGAKPAASGRRGDRVVIDESGDLEKTPLELAKALRYLNKYLGKGDIVTKDEDGRKLRGNAELPDNYVAPKHEGTRRTQSLGLGRHFFTALARYHAAMGLPLRDLNYVIEGFTLRRNRVSEHRRRESVFARSGSLTTAETLIDRRKTFTMRGAAANLFVTEYERERRQRSRKPLSLREMGDEVIRAAHAALTEDISRKLASFEWQCAREFQGDGAKFGTPLPDTIEPVPIYRVMEDGSPADGKHRQQGKRAPLEKLSAWERYCARKAECERLEKLYASQIGPKRAMSAYKARLSERPLDELLTETHREARNARPVQRFASPADSKRVREIQRELRERGDEEGERLLALLDKWRNDTEKEPFKLPRHDFGAVEVAPSLVKRWINHSDDYQWRWRREEAIERFCVQLAGRKDVWRLIQNPRGEQFMQRRGYSGVSAEFRCSETGKRIKSKGYPVWFSRKIMSDGEFESAMRGELVVKRSNRDAVFLGPSPLQLE